MIDKIIREDSLVVTMTKAQLRSLLEEILSQASPPVRSEPEILDIEALSKWTGYKVSTLHSFTSDRVIPFYKPPHGGRKLFFDRDDVLKWLRTNRVETNDEFVRNHRNGKRTPPRSKQAEIEFLRQNLREAKAFLKLWQFIHSLLLIEADKN